MRIVFLASLIGALLGTVQLAHAQTIDYARPAADLPMMVRSEKGKYPAAIVKRLQTGYEALLAKQYPQATEAFNEVLRRDKDNEDAHLGIAMAYHRGSQFDKAIHHYNEAIRLDPNNVYAFLNALMTNQYRPDTVQEKLTQMKAQYPRWGMVPAVQGLLYFRMYQLPKAISELEQAVKLDPDNVVYLYNLAVVYDFAGFRDDARSLYRKVQANPQARQILLAGDLTALDKRLQWLVEAQQQ